MNIRRKFAMAAALTISLIGVQSVRTQLRADADPVCPAGSAIVTGSPAQTTSPSSGVGSSDNYWKAALLNDDVAVTKPWEVWTPGFSNEATAVIGLPATRTITRIHVRGANDLNGNPTSTILIAGEPVAIAVSAWTMKDVNVVTNAVTIKRTGPPQNVSEIVLCASTGGGGSTELSIAKTVRLAPPVGTNPPFVGAVTTPTFPVLAEWRIVVTNTGTLPVSGIVVSDPAVQACINQQIAPPIGPLSPGASLTFTCGEQLNASRENEATVTATGVTALKAKASVSLLGLNGMTLTKKVRLTGSGQFADVATAPSGPASFEFQITVTNTGANPLTVKVDDPSAPNCFRPSLTLAAAGAAGASVQYVCSIAGVTTSFVNKATATAISVPAGGTPPPVVGQATVTIGGTDFVIEGGGTPVCNPLPAQPADLTKRSVCVPFPTGNRNFVVPKFNESRGATNPPGYSTISCATGTLGVAPNFHNGTELSNPCDSHLKPWTPPARPAGWMAICTAAQHDKWWVVAVDGHYYPTWHPATDVENGQPCTYAHDHGDDPASSTLYYWSQGIPFGYANEVSNRRYDADIAAGRVPVNSAHRHEDHVGHKITVQNKWKAVSGGPQDSPARSLTLSGHECYWLSHIHQGTHTADALLNNEHEYHLNVMCDDRSSPSAVDFTEFRIKLLATFGEPGGFNDNCPDVNDNEILPNNIPQPYLTETGPALQQPDSQGASIVGPNSAFGGRPSLYFDDKRSVACAANAGWFWKPSNAPYNPVAKDPSNGMQHQNYTAATDGPGVHELWKPAARITKSDGSFLLNSAAYYVVFDPARVLNKQKDPGKPEFPALAISTPGEPQVKPSANSPDAWDLIVPTIDLCLPASPVTGRAVGPLYGRPFCDPVKAIENDAATSGPASPIGLAWKGLVDTASSLTRRYHPLNPFNGTQRAIHPKEINIANGSGVTTYCTNAAGQVVAGAAGTTCTSVLLEIPQFINTKNCSESGTNVCTPRNGSGVNSDQMTDLSNPTQNQNDQPPGISGSENRWGFLHEWVRMYDGANILPQNIVVIDTTGRRSLRVSYPIATLSASVVRKVPILTKQARAPWLDAFKA